MERVFFQIRLRTDSDGTEEHLWLDALPNITNSVFTKPNTSTPRPQRLPYSMF